MNNYWLERIQEKAAVAEQWHPPTTGEDIGILHPGAADYHFQMAIRPPTVTDLTSPWQPPTQDEDFSWVPLAPIDCCASAENPKKWEQQEFTFVLASDDQPACTETYVQPDVVVGDMAFDVKSEYVLAEEVRGWDIDL